jgi:nucleotide-binding universal stress UspA family protein
MRALVWLREETWEELVDALPELLPGGAELTLIHVADAGAQAAAGAPALGLLGRGRRGPGGPRALEAVSEAGAAELVAAAAARVGRGARTVARRGRLEDEVLAAAAGQDALVVARDGDRTRLGPRSLAPPTRFVVDHAPCTVLLVWPEAAPQRRPAPPDRTPPPPPPPRVR